MTILYSCRHDGDQYRITKFDSGLNPTSSYLCTAKECECPAGPRPMCRHREMLPRFIARDAVGTGWMYDYDRGGWVDQRWMIEVEAKPYPSPELAADLAEFFTEDEIAIQKLSLEDPMELRNTIAAAVVEPTPAPTTPTPKRASWRRF